MGSAASRHGEESDEEILSTWVPFGEITSFEVYLSPDEKATARTKGPASTAHWWAKDVNGQDRRIPDAVRDEVLPLKRPWHPGFLDALNAGAETVRQRMGLVQQD